MLINFTHLRNDFIFGFTWETSACGAGNFCRPGRPQIPSFFFDDAKVRKFHAPSKLFFKKSTQKSTQ